MVDFQKEFPDNRLSGDTSLRQAQLVMLRLLKIFDFICRKNNLIYWLEGGTLLGAVRHKGFIPWDDDLDVMMPRPDYDRFMEIAKEELPFDIYHDTRDEFQRLRDRFSKRVDEGAEPDLHFISIYIDIFPAKKFPYMRKVLCRVRMLIPPYRAPGIYKDFPLKKKIKRVIAGILHYILTYSGLQFVIKGLCLIGAKKYWSYDLAITWHYHFNDEWIFPLSTLQFEDEKFPVPGNYTAVLTHQFGNYMEPPPISERNHHHNKYLLPITPCNHPEALDWNNFH